MADPWNNQYPGGQYPPQGYGGPPPQYGNYPPQQPDYGGPPPQQGAYPPQQNYPPQQGYPPHGGAPPPDNFGPPRRQDSYGPPAAGGFEHGHEGRQFGAYDASNPQGHPGYYGPPGGGPPGSEFDPSRDPNAPPPDPNAPEGERGLGGALLGGATGAFFGHKKEHGILGAIGGAIAGSVLQDQYKKHSGGGQSSWGGGSGFFGGGGSQQGGHHGHHGRPSGW